MKYAIARHVLGFVLLLAAGLKGYQLATRPVLEDGLLQSRIFQGAVVEIELFFGLWLLSGIVPALAWRCSVTYFTLLAGVALWNAATGGISCGCFGDIKVHPWWTFLFDVGAVASLLRWRPPRDESGRLPPYNFAPIGKVLLLTVLIGVPSGIAMTASAPIQTGGDEGIARGAEFVLLEPAKWIGQTLPVLPYLNKGSEISSGRWILLFYHHACPKCQAVIPEYEQLVARLRTRPDAPRIALIEVPPFSENQQKVPSACLLAKLNPSTEWFLATPCELETKDAVVTGVNTRVEPGQVAHLNATRSD